MLRFIFHKPSREAFVIKRPSEREVPILLHPVEELAIIRNSNSNLDPSFSPLPTLSIFLGENLESRLIDIRVLGNPQDEKHS